VVTNQEDSIFGLRIVDAAQQSKTKAKHPIIIMSEEPPAKKTKTGWEDHKCNTANALMKANENDHLTDIAKAPITILQGIGEKHNDMLEHLHIKTVSELATYKYYLMARALKTLAEVEEKDGRKPESVMNVDKAVDKEQEKMTFTEMVASPIHIIQGLTKEAEELFKHLGVHTVGELAEFKYARWAEALLEMSKYENTLTETERKVDRELHKLE
jgi:predicted RecB family nuclease